MNPNQNYQGKVSTRTYNWLEMVIEQWQGKWRAPDIAYEFDGRKFESTDQYSSGIYKPR